MASYTDILKSFTAAQSSANTNALKSLQMDRQLQQQQFQNQLALDEFDYRKNQDEQTRREQQQRNMVTDYFSAAELADREARTKLLQNADSREQLLLVQAQEKRDLGFGFNVIRSFGYDQQLNDILLGKVDAVDVLQQNPELAQLITEDPIFRKHIGGQVLGFVNPETGGPPGPNDPHTVEIANDKTGTTSAMTLNRSNDPNDTVAIFDRDKANFAIRRAIAQTYLLSGEAPLQSQQKLAAIINGQADNLAQKNIPLFNPNQDAINGMRAAPDQAGNPIQTRAPQANTQTPLGVPDADPNMMRDSVEAARDGYDLDAQTQQQIDLNNRVITTLENERKKYPVFTANKEAKAIDREIRNLQGQNTELAATIKQPLERLDQQPADPRGLGQITADANTAVSSYAAAQSDRANRVASSAQALASTVVPSLATQLQRQGNAVIDNINNARSTTPKLTGQDLALLDRLRRNGNLPDDVYTNLLAREGADGGRTNRVEAFVDDNVTQLNSTQGDLTSLTNNTVNDRRQREEFAQTQSNERRDDLNAAIKGVNTEVADSVRRLNITDEVQANSLGEKVETAISGQGFKEVWTRNGNPDTWAQTMTDAAARRVLLDGATEFQLAIDTVNSGDRSTELDGKVASRLQKGKGVKFYQRLMNSSIKDPRNISAYYLQRASGLPPKAFLVNVLAEASGVLNREIRPAEMEGLAKKMTVLYSMFPQYRNQPEVVSAYMIDQLTGGK